MQQVFGVIAIATVVGACASPLAAQPAGGAGMAALERMRRAYDGAWYNTLTFVQRTITQQGTAKPDTATWYESVVGARLRIDMGDLSLGNGALFTAETTYVVRNGAVVRTNPVGNPFLPLIMGVYLQPVAQTARELASFGFDLSSATSSTWEGRPVTIVGAASTADTTSAQFWVDDRQLVVRVTGAVRGTGGMDVRIGGYERVGRAWLGTRVSMASPTRSQVEEYSDWKVDVTLSAQLFDLTTWKTAPHWAPMQPGAEWPSYHRDLAATRYSPLDQITRENVSRLAIAWTWKPDSGPSPEFKNENTPLMVGGVLYFTTGAQRNVVAVDAATGAEKWRWKFEESTRRFRHSPRTGAGRGVGYWADGRTARIFTVTPGFRLVALDAATGKPVPSFGDSGFVDLKAHLGVPVNLDTTEIGNSSPPLVFENVVVVPPALREGSRPASFRNVPGRVLAFDARTGALKWRFNTIPVKDEFGYDTWLDGSADFTGNAGVWAPMSLDTKRGYLYLPVEGATGDYYGGHRPGDDLFSSSLVCLDIRTGKRVWHYQIVHHDIWDRDNPTAPVLMDLTVDGRRIEAVAQITKQAFVYVFDRVTGKPVWPIVERPVPQTDVPGERTAPTQPYPTKPPAFDVQGVRVNDLIDFTPELRAKAIEAVKGLRLGELYTPPSAADAPDGTKGTLSAPGSVGGANWEHGSYDPETGTLYVGSYTSPNTFALDRDSARSDMRYVSGGGRVPNAEGLPLLKPPYNRITAIDLSKGALRWTVPGGDTPNNIRNHPALQGLTIPPTGARTRPAVMATKTLLFTTEGYGSRAVLHVHDKTTGARVADIPLPSSVGGSPMTYSVNGRQYVALWVGRQGMPAQLVTLTVDGSR